jgi:ribosomal protein L40E
MDFYIYNSQLEYITPDYSITTPADAENAVAVGATYWEDDSLEIYSSRGPTYDGRLKPDISAPAGVSVTTRDKPFFGTSASAPHVSGAAALIMEAFPEFQPNDITTFLQSRAVDLGASGPDYEFGYGRLWLGDAPALTEAEPQVTSTSPPPQPTETPETGLPIDPTDTPTPQYNPIDTPEPSTGSIGSSELLLICACVGLPGLLGLGAIGLLVGVLLYRRSRKSTAQRPAARQPAYQAPPAASPVVKPPPPARQAQAVCPRCQTPHQPQARFCNHCGFDLQSDSPPQPEAGVCEQCGAKLRPSAKFCSNCGHRR